MYRDRQHPWVSVPIGDAPTRWRTGPIEKTVLVVARNLTSTAWGLEFLGEILSDPRIQVIFTVEDRSPSVYSRGALELLDLVEAVTVPWSQAVSTPFDLAISSSLRGSLESLKAPLLLGLHGAGTGRPGVLLPGSRVPRPSPDSQLEGIAATTVAIAHSEQASYVGPGDDDLEIVVTGDPCFDRLVASEPLRLRYRQILGVGERQRLVLISSTWGAGALLNTCPDLALRLACELPTDGYRIAMVIHPNVWTGHGGWQVRSWLAKARDAGVLALPPWRSAWRSALVASDAVVHDHGSVGFYAAATGRPTATASFDHTRLMPGSSIAELGIVTPALDLGRSLRPQIDTVIEAYDAGRYRSVCQRLTSAPGDSLRLHRDLVYRLLGLECQAEAPRVLAVDPPPEPLPTLYSFFAATAVRDHRAVVVDRYPATTPPPRWHRHIVADTSEPYSALVSNAAIVTESGEAARAEELLLRYPGCRYVMLRPEGADPSLWHRNGSRWTLQPTDSDHGSEPAVAASAIYALETSGHKISANAVYTAVVDGRDWSWRTVPL